MTFAPFPSTRVTLANDRVSRDDSRRQEAATVEILKRLGRQPGVVLADEVGMGKTFVAMAVAASVIIDRPDAGPVVVMVPSSLKDKWPRDWALFQEKCLRRAPEIRARSAKAGVAFLKLLDDPVDRRAHVIFLTHGALHRSLRDGFAQLALIRRAFKGRSTLQKQRARFHRFAGRLLRLDSSIEHRAPGLIGDLLERPCESWLKVIHRAHESFRESITDDPVPTHLAAALDAMDGPELNGLVDALRDLPLNESANVRERLVEIRRVLKREMNGVWRVALNRSNFRSPLLILDEAHHVKNPATRLASLFVDPEAAEESEYFTTAGALGGKFERMLFLTATPFQLGHQELVRVLERFEGVNWRAARRPLMSRAEFETALQSLSRLLDDAQAAALRLDRAWGKLSRDHLVARDGSILDPDRWWDEARTTEDGGVVGQVAEQVRATEIKMRAAEDALSPWVLRHLKVAVLPDSDTQRRRVFPGDAILDDGMGQDGLEIGGEALLPFLLAGRAQALLATHASGRALFAEGLSSSFEAYLETRRGRLELDEDEAGTDNNDAGELAWYLEELGRALPRGRHAKRVAHPKIKATAERAVQLWETGEKVVIFCHYRATGRALRLHVSSALRRRFLALGATKLSTADEASVQAELDRLGERLLDQESPVRRKVERSIRDIVRSYPEFDRDAVEGIVDVILRFLRTPSFLARYFPLGQRESAEAFAEAIGHVGADGLALEVKIKRFCTFLAERCIDSERKEYVQALSLIQTGTHSGHDVLSASDPAESLSRTDGTMLLPNVRLANGEVRDETRRRLLLAFNTPLFPEILVASSVLAEGVDLHLNCRHVIHHDLCWNPSTLEQRSGRVDRIGSKAEQVKRSIHLYLPYIAATQDEKMYRVVRDRERWFQIVMGETYEVDETSTDATAERIPLPDTVREQLALRLHL